MSSPQPATWRGSRRWAWRIAVAASIAAHLIPFGLLSATHPPSPPEAAGARSVDVELVRVSPPPLGPPRLSPTDLRKAERLASPAQGSPANAHSVSHPMASGAMASTSPPRQASSGNEDAARLSFVLRQSGVGCANADLAHLSALEREACRQRFARGAASAPYISGIPPDKQAYYAALSESQGDMNRDWRGGHGPEIHCDAKKRLGLKLGGCTLAAPMTPFTPEADVPGP